MNNIINVKKSTLEIPKGIPFSQLNMEEVGRTDGYDGHSLRAYTYYSDLMPDIDPDDVESINSIKKKYADLRSKSKQPTFLLTYQGTHHGLHSNLGMPLEQAKYIEANFNKLYSVSIKAIAEKLEEAKDKGYITGAFGLRVRTPLLHRSIQGTNANLSPMASQEARSAGNALGQSWCLLNCRSASAFMKKVRAHPEFKYKIKICAQIHDAVYLLIKDELAVIEFVNKHLVEETYWNDHPDIYHPNVGLGGELSIFYPSWKHEYVIPNNVFGDDLLKCLQNIEEEK